LIIHPCLNAPPFRRFIVIPFGSAIPHTITGQFDVLRILKTWKYREHVSLRQSSSIGDGR
jgi:hypothetical protein